MLTSLLLLSLSTLTLAIPPYTPLPSTDFPPSTTSLPFPSTNLPTIPTCPASTPTTRTYKTVIRTTIITTTLAPRHCPSFSTRIDEPAPWSSCAFNAATCLRPACLTLSTITQPCITDPCCTRTATDTVFAPCPTKCPEGCATSWTVVDLCALTPVPMPTPV